MKSQPSPALQALLIALGAVIRKRREDIGLSQDELGHLAGLHRTYVGSVERGERNVTLGSILALAAPLQLPAHQLLLRAGM